MPRKLRGLLAVEDVKEYRCLDCIVTSCWLSRRKSGVPGAPECFAGSMPQEAARSKGRDVAWAQARADMF